ncbi:MAG: DUF3043 domain-containing protein [Actinomycetaceae bacterium]|nr:DUF3043 domain-containing protein [Actinomycetaceae bacterium]MDU0969381.1 DUF3043 domain-containing protein [Actinomycetaceae bacterium]
MPWKNTEEAPEEPQRPTGKGSGKGRPTPKRKEAEKRNQHPLVGSKKEAKERKKRQREIAYERQRAALDGTGDERYLPVNDRGPYRRFIRNYIDARWSVSEFLMPILLVIIIAMFFLPGALKNAPTAARVIPLYGTWVLIAICIIECSIMTTRVNHALMREFNVGKEIKRGNGRYVLYRMTMPRRLRQPRPAVERGEK